MVCARMVRGSKTEESRMTTKPTPCQTGQNERRATYSGRQSGSMSILWVTVSLSSQAHRSSSHARPSHRGFSEQCLHNKLVICLCDRRFSPRSKSSTINCKNMSVGKVAESLCTTGLFLCFKQMIMDILCLQ